VSLSVNRVAADGSTATTGTLVSQSDLVARNAGSIVLVGGGDITLNDGTAPSDKTAVSTDGGGQVSITSTGGAITVNTGVATESGSVDIRSQKSVVWNGDDATVSSSDPTAQTELTIRPVGSGQDLVIGGDAGAVNPNAWRFAAEDLERLQAGYDRIVIGGNDFTGRVTIDGTVTGGLAFTNPVEIRTAAGAQVEIKGEVRADSMSVDGDAPVTFNDATIVLDEAEGLQIQGAAVMRGDVVITAPSLAFLGGAGTVTAQAGATLTLLPQDKAQAIVIGSDAAAGPGFELGTRELQALGNGFAAVEIGHADRAADLRIAGDAVFSDAVTLWGRTVTMEAGSVITSTGDVTLAAAGDLTVGRIEAAGQTVTVRAEGTGATVESGAGESMNIVAANVVLEGLGPVDGAGRALRVTSDRVDVYTPTGMVLRQTQTSGEVHFLVMVDGVSYLQVVNTQRNAVASGTSELGSVQSTQGTVPPLYHGGDRARAMVLGSATAWGAVSGQAAGSGSAASAGWTAVAAQRVLASTARLATADVTWTAQDDDATAERLQRAFLLGQAGAQPAAAGLLVATQVPFDYWVESLTL